MQLNLIDYFAWQQFPPVRQPHVHPLLHKRVDIAGERGELAQAKRRR
jgi:hypothetical protein